jgi:hypothetical protein
MEGRIRVGVWLRFSAEWQGDGRSFTWRATAGPAGILRVVDRFANGAGGTDVRLLGRVPLVRADDEDSARSGAGRAAVEAAMWAPAALRPELGVEWEQTDDEVICATWDVPPERPSVRLRVAEDGAVRSVWLDRWDGGSNGGPGYVPCGGDVAAERRFGDLVLPSEVSVGWGYGTPAFRPFFEAQVTGAEPV